MAVVESAPTAIHIGDDELPFVEIGAGNKLKVLQVKEREGLWIVENIFQGGFAVQTHRHTGPVWGYTTSGAWKYKESEYVNRAGSFLYEPAGSVHTLTCIEDDTRVWFHMYGANLNLDDDGNVDSVTDGAGTLAALLRAVRGAGPPAPQRARRLMVELVGSRRIRRGPAARVPRRAPPHATGLLAGHAGPARVLGGAEARRPHRRRPRAGAVLGERGRRGDGEPRRRRARRHAQHAAGDGSAATHRLPAAARPELQGQGHRRDGRTDPHDLPRHHGPTRANSGERRVRARGRRPPPDPGDRRARRAPPTKTGRASRRGRSATPAGRTPRSSAATKASTATRTSTWPMYAIELAGRRRAEPAREDLLSLILAGNFGAGPMSDVEFGSFFVQLITAANDTTKSMLSGGLLALIEHPDQQAELRADASLIPGAVEEILRYANPLHYFRRTATADTVLRDTKINEGDKVADVLHVGQPRRGRLRRPAGVRHPPQPEPAAVVRHRRALLPRRRTSPGSRAGSSSRSCSTRSPPSSSPANPAASAPTSTTG